MGTVYGGCGVDVRWARVACVVGAGWVMDGFEVAGYGRGVWALGNLCPTFVFFF